MSKQVESVSAVLKVFSILQELSQCQTASLSELETSLMMSKSTIYRFLQTMQTLGYVEQEADTERYFLTLELFHIGARALYHTDMQRIANPIMKRIVAQTSETVHLGELDKDAVIYTHKVESNYSLRMGSQIGRRADIYSTAMGKILTAFSADGPDVAEHLKSKEFIKHTEKTITSYDEFMGQVEQTRQTGFAYDREENEPSLLCIAVPIYDFLEQAVASMSMSFPTFRCDEAKFVRYHEIMKQAAIELSTQLGSKTVASVFATDLKPTL
jgi:IclR family KDG regulon transcriptional repressor